MNKPIEKALPLAAIMTSVAALVTVLVINSSTSTHSQDKSQLANLASKIERLEKRLTALSTDSGLSDGTNALNADSKGSDGAADLATLEARQSRLEQKLQNYGIFERFEEHEKLIKESYKVAIDPERAAKERFEALKILREEGRIDQAVVDSMMDLWDQSLDDDKTGPYHRWALMENLRGTNDPRFRDNVLSMLQQEPGAKMTGQAIATLEPMLPDPAVQEWLTHLSSNGQEPKIRDYAANVLQNAEAGDK